jgi:hypothetical protein
VLIKRGISVHYSRLQDSRTGRSEQNYAYLRHLDFADKKTYPQRTIFPNLAFRSGVDGHNQGPLRRWCTHVTKSP